MTFDLSGVPGMVLKTDLTSIYRYIYGCGGGGSILISVALVSLNKNMNQRCKITLL